MLFRSQRSDGPPALTAGDYGSLLNAWTTCESVGCYRGRPCLAVSLPNPPPPLPPGWEAQGLRQWFGRLPDDLTSIAMQASQLLEWVRTEAPPCTLHLFMIRGGRFEEAVTETRSDLKIRRPLVVRR